MNACRKLLFQRLDWMTGPALTSGDLQAIQPLSPRKMASDQDGECLATQDANRVMKIARLKLSSD